MTEGIISAFDRNFCFVVCQHCGQLINSEIEFRFHYDRCLPNHHGDSSGVIKDFNFECTVCERGFVSKSYLTSHIESEHIRPVEIILQNEILYCNTCLSDFQSQVKLGQHLASNSCKRQRYHQNELRAVNGVTEEDFEDTQDDFEMPSDNESEQNVKRKKRARKQLAHMDKENVKKVFSCKICIPQKLFQSQKLLSCHLIAKHSDEIKLFPCDQCDFKATDKISLDRHIRNRHIALEIDKHLDGSTCKECGKHFNRLKCAKRHVQKKHLGGCGLASPCHICGKILATPFNLKLHMNTKHSEEFDMKCIYCEFQGKPSDLKAHILAVHRTKDEHKDHKCDICGEVFDVLAYLKMHVKESHGEEIKCRLCDHKFAYKDWSKHISLVHDEGLEEFCDYCDFKSTLGKIKVHRKEAHPKLNEKANLLNKNIRCPHCPEEFLRRENLNCHLRLCHPNKIEACVCDICGKTFQFQQNLVLHKNSVHFDKPMECEHCGKMIKSKRKMVEHLSLVHDIGKAVQCKHCDFMATKGKLNDHEKNVHEEELKTPCTICNSLIWAKNMALHKRTVHLFDPKTCPVCHNILPNSYKLTQHVRRVHNTKRESKCKQCDFTTGSRLLLQSHMKAVHLKVKNCVCETCQLAFPTKRTLKAHIAQVHAKNNQKSIVLAAQIPLKKLKSKKKCEKKKSDKQILKANKIKSVLKSKKKCS